MIERMISAPFCSVRPSVARSRDGFGRPGSATLRASVGSIEAAEKPVRRSLFLCAGHPRLVNGDSSPTRIGSDSGQVLPAQDLLEPLVEGVDADHRLVRAAAVGVVAHRHLALGGLEGGPGGLVLTH